MKNRIVVLGKENSLYTKMIVFQLTEQRLGFDLMVELTKNKERNPHSSIFLKLKILLDSGPFKHLSIFNWFTWYLLFERFRNKKNPIIDGLFYKYNGVLLEPKLYVDDINNEIAQSFLNDNCYDYAIFAGVGIVKNEVISTVQKFCINAHPAPLPECRGGGALECTLFKSLKPSVTVHIATAGIDEGPIINVRELELTNKDNFVTILHKLTELCAIELSKVCKKLFQDQELILEPNDGELNFWRDWTSQKQFRARINLKKMLNNIKN